MRLTQLQKECDVVEVQAMLFIGSSYAIHRTRVMLSLHVATISVQVRRFDREGLHQLQNV